MRRIQSTLALSAPLMAGLVACQAGAAVSAPYSNSFTDNVDGWAFEGEPSTSVDPSAEWTLDTAGGYLSGTALSQAAGSKVATSGLVEVDGLTGDFFVSTHVRPQTFSYTSNTTFGVIAKSLTDSVFGEDGFGESAYEFQVGRDGDVKIYEHTADGPNKLGQFLSDTNDTIMGADTEVYIELRGVYNGANLELTGMVSWDIPNDDGPSTPFSRTLSVVDETPIAGNYYGVRIYPGATSQNVTAEFDDFYVGTDVPEPASMSLIGVGLMGLVARRRRA